MAEHKDEKKAGQEYSVDEILAEYGSSRVVEFPERDKAQAEDKPSAPDRPRREEPQEPRPVDEIVPPTVGRKLAARLSTLRRRADHYADHMYDQAEPDEETRLAEKYIPGVDREEAPEEAERPKRRPLRRPAKTPPDTPPADLAARWQKGLKARRRRTGFAFVISILAVVCSLELPVYLSLDLPAGLDFYQLQCWVLTALLAAVGALCWDVLAAGLRGLVTLRPGAETLMTLAWAFTLADGFTAGHLEARLGCLPCAAATAFGLAFHLWGFQNRRRADRISAKTAAQARTPYVVTLDENKWSGRPAYTKWSGTPVGLGSQLQSDDAGTAVYRVAAPLLLLGALLCAVMASVGQGAGGRFLWAASVCFTAVSAWPALLAWGLPWRKLALRLSKVGAALAGWSGVSRCRQGGIVVTDGDLFPPGSVRVSQVRVFGGVSTEKAVAYTATLLRVMNCGLTRPFHDLLRTQGAIYREVSGVRPNEGGMSGIIRNQEVLVGTASFMHLMKVPMPQGLNVKNALFCSIGGELAGMFLLDYALNSEVNPSLSALLRAEVNPILATRDFNLIPALLEKKFRLPVDKMEFPPVERRLELSRADQDHDETPVALLCREGLTAFSDAVVGGRRLRSAVRRSLAFTLLGAVIGLALTFYLAAKGAYTTLTPIMFLIFMALWLVPELLLAGWVNQY